MKGRVKWWNKDQKYGFIEYNENENVFVHIQENDEKYSNLDENKEIEFYIENKNNSSYIHILKIIET